MEYQFYNTEDIQALIPQIIKEGAKMYQVETLLYFLRCTQYAGMNHRISKALEVWHNEPSVVASILPLYMNGIYLSRYGNYQGPQLIGFAGNKEAVRRYLNTWNKSISQSLPKRLTPYMFFWESAFPHPFGHCTQMAYITWMLHDSALGTISVLICLLWKLMREQDISALYWILHQPITRRISTSITRWPFGRCTRRSL